MVALTVVAIVLPPCLPLEHSSASVGQLAVPILALLALASALSAGSSQGHLLAVANPEEVPNQGCLPDLPVVVACDERQKMDS